MLQGTKIRETHYIPMVDQSTHGRILALTNEVRMPKKYSTIDKFDMRLLAERGLSMLDPIRAILLARNPKAKAQIY